MPYLSDPERRTTAVTPAYVSEIGIVGGTSSLAAVRARQMARQREISSASARKMRSDEYLRNLYEEEEREKQEEKGRARARTALLEEQRIEQLAAKADRIRFRTETELPSFVEKRTDLPAESSEIPYSVRRARRLEEQSRRKSDERREQVSKDLERARALLHEERKRDNLELARDIGKGYGNLVNHRKPERITLRDEGTSYRREPTSSILKSSNRRRFDTADDYQYARSRLADDGLSERLSDLSFGRTNGIQREVGSSSLRGSTSRALSNGSRTPKEVRWSLDEY